VSVEETVADKCLARCETRVRITTPFAQAYHQQPRNPIRPNHIFRCVSNHEFIKSRTPLKSGSFSPIPLACVKTIFIIHLGKGLGYRVLGIGFWVSIFWTSTAMFKLYSSKKHLSFLEFPAPREFRSLRKYFFAVLYDRVQTLFIISLRKSLGYKVLV
jgi:hypothetical protein